MTFASVVTAAVDSALAVCMRLVLAIGDFSECNTIARFAMGVVGHYLGMVMARGICYLVGDVVVTKLRRPSRRATALLLWRCRGNAKTLPESTPPASITPDEVAPRAR